MEISEVRVKLIGNPTDRLKAFASVTLDGDFVIRDIKVIDGASGVFVAMPSRKLADRCSRCGSKNHLRAKFCNECGEQLPKGRIPRDRLGRSKLHADIAHPINTECRQRLQKEVVAAYETEAERSQEPGYEPDDAYDDFDYEDDTEGVLENDADNRPEADVDTSEHNEDDDNDGGYDDLIEQLKKDAAERRATHDRKSARSDAPPVRSTPTKEPEHNHPPAPAVSNHAKEPSRVTVEAEMTEEGDDFGAGII